MDQSGERDGIWEAQENSHSKIMSTGCAKASQTSEINPSGPQAIYFLASLFDSFHMSSCLFLNTPLCSKLLKLILLVSKSSILPRPQKWLKFSFTLEMNILPHLLPAQITRPRYISLVTRICFKSTQTERVKPGKEKHGEKCIGIAKSWKREEKEKTERYD